MATRPAGTGISRIASCLTANGTKSPLVACSPIISANKQADYDNDIGAEVFQLENGVLNTDGSGTYDQVIRGIPNSEKNSTPSGNIAWQTAHSEPSVVIIDPTYDLKALDAAFQQNVSSRFAQFFAFEGVTDITAGDGRIYFQVPSKYNGDVLSTANATVITAGTTGDTTIQIHNLTEAVDMLSTPITIASGALTGSGVVDPPNAGVSTGDILRVDIDTVSTTAPKGLIVNLEFAN